MTRSSVPDKKTVKKIFGLLNKLGPDPERNELKEDEGARIAAALLLNDEDTDDDASGKRYALQLYLRNLGDQSPGAQKFYSYVGIAEYYQRNNNTKAIEAASRAINERKSEKDILGTDLDDSRAYQAYYIKARALQSEKKYNEAVDIYKEGLQELEKTDDLLEFITQTVCIFALQERYRDIMSLFRSTSEEMRAKWLSDQAEISHSSSKYVRRAALETRRIDILVNYYEQAIEYCSAQQKSPSAAARILQFELAMIYRNDSRTTQLARITLDAIRAEEGAGSDISNLPERVTIQLVDIIHEEYTLTGSHAVKRKSVQVLSTMLETLADRSVLATMMEAEALLILAKMQIGLRDIDQIRQAKTAMDKAFRLCIEDLEDDIDWNDSEAFRVLSKVLMMFPTKLEADALIAGSLHFSDVEGGRSDRRHRRYTLSSSDSDSTVDSIRGRRSPSEDGSFDFDAEDTSKQSAPETSELKGDGADGEDATKDHEKPVIQDETMLLLDHSDHGHDTGEPVNGQSGPTKEHEGEHEGTEEKPPATNATNLTNGDPVTSTNDDPKVNTGALAILDTVIGPSDVSEASQSDGDKSDAGSSVISISMQDFNLFADPFRCSGECDGDELRRWPLGGSLYYRCLQCPDVDLCPDCFKKQDDYNQGNGDGFWTRVCWGEHQYLKLPIEGWEGVKDGFIRVGVRKPKKFRDWLKDVKVRWSKALGEMGKEPVTSGGRPQRNVEAESSRASFGSRA